MLLIPNVDFTYCTDSYSASNPVAITPGTIVTTGASNADGAAVALIGTGLTHDCEFLEIGMHTNETSAVDSSTLIDILIDPAGGTSWTTLIASLPAGHLLTPTAIYQTYRTWAFPVWIPAGASIGAMGRNITGSTRPVSVFCTALGGTRDQNWWCGQKVDAIGDIRASSGGTGVPPNASANAFGAWTSIGSATGRKYGALTFGAQGESGTSMLAAAYHAEIGIGSVKLDRTYMLQSNSSESISGMWPTPFIRKTIPEATQLQARIKSSSAGQDTLQFIIHGVA